MRRHAARPDPRAHWLLLVLGTTLLLGLLALDGYPKKENGPEEPQWHQGAETAITQGGPVIRFERGAARTVHTLPGTVALTFDGGPDPQWTPKVLDHLREHRVKATFFLVGAKVNRYPELVKRILAEGHEVGVQSYSDVDLWAQPYWLRALEIRLGANAIAGVTGKRTALFRPPFLDPAEDLTEAQAEVMRQAGDEGYLVVLSNVEAVVTVDDSEELERSMADGKRYTTVTEAIGAASALAQAPAAMRVSGEMLRVAQAALRRGHRRDRHARDSAVTYLAAHGFPSRSGVPQAPETPRWPTPAHSWANGSMSSMPHTPIWIDACWSWPAA